ncbi:MAG: DUF2877 domain-containing protein [Acidimicrobiia bacterium]|nr:DUF2877 domain-containing protein [Acidimicrobiia bacterium]
MTNPDTAGIKPPPTPVRVSGVASTALYSVITGSGTKATVLGSSNHAVWLQAGERVVVIGTSDSTRLPNGVQLAAESKEGLFAAIEHEGAVEVGHGRLMLDGLSVEVTRWWDPRPTLAATTPEALIAAADGLPDDVPDIDPEPLRTALQARSAGGILHASRALLGKGPGLTPEGDDYLAGALAATRLLAEALGWERIISMIAGISIPLADLAEARTTTFSAALIQSALRGQVAEPAGALLRALTGRGDVAGSHLGLIRVGHTSGPALAAGIVLGAQSLVRKD